MREIHKESLTKSERNTLARETGVNSERIRLISTLYSKRKTKYICKHLTEDEFLVIGSTEGLSPSHYLALAKTNHILKDTELVKKYENCRTLDEKHYIHNEVPWLKAERNLLKCELKRNPSGKELIEDFREHQNGERYKVFYCLNYPEKIQY